jgi:hypothetical protein
MSQASGSPPISSGILKERFSVAPVSLNPPSVAKTFARCRQVRHLEILVGPKDVTLHDFDRLRVRCRHQAHWPVGTNHKPVTAV